jgi:cytochrome c biogenesis protein
MASTPSTITLRQSLGLVWRSLRSMRTALVLLALLALASIPGTLLPQEPVSPQQVAHFMAVHPLLGEFLSRAHLFDVYGAWWFVLALALLFTSLVACLVPRTRALVKVLRARPLQAREIDSFPQYAELAVSAAPDEVVARSRKVLRRRYFRVSWPNGSPVLAADKGILREAGSLLFHWAFLLILIGSVYGKGTGFTGYAVVVEGQSWADGFANFDGNIRTGRFFGGDFPQVQLHLNSFSDAYSQTGLPMDFVSNVALSDPSGRSMTADVRVNHPATFDGLRFYQYGFGWAPVIQVRSGGRLLFSGPVPFVQPQTPPAGVPQMALPWHGVVKLPTLGPQEGAIDLQLWPDVNGLLAAYEGKPPLTMLQPHEPVVTAQLYRGPLLSAVYGVLDTSVMQAQGKQQLVGQGRTVDLGEGLSIGFPQLKQYAEFEVTHDPGVPIIFAAAILILVGLLPALYTSRRKLWVRAEQAERGSTLKVGGFALQRREQFEEEFRRVVSDLARASGGQKT